MQTVMPILPSANPFVRHATESVTELSPVVVARVVKTCHTFTALLRTGQLPDPGTLSRYASEIVGLHKRLLDGSTVLSKDAVERYARMPGAGAERRARKALQETLEAAYAVLEPLLPAELEYAA